MLSSNSKFTLINYLGYLACHHCILSHRFGTKYSEIICHKNIFEMQSATVLYRCWMRPKSLNEMYITAEAPGNIFETILDSTTHCIFLRFHLMISISIGVTTPCQEGHAIENGIIQVIVINLVFIITVLMIIWWIEVWFKTWMQNSAAHLNFNPGGIISGINMININFN